MGRCSEDAMGQMYKRKDPNARVCHSLTWHKKPWHKKPQHAATPKQKPSANRQPRYTERQPPSACC